MKRAFLILTLFLLHGCSFLNPLLTEVAFRDYANDHIGSDIDDLLDRPSYKLLNTLSLEGGLTEYQFKHTYHSTQSGKKYSCEWALIASNNTRQVKSWRYISEPSACMYRYFHEGAW